MAKTGGSQYLVPMPIERTLNRLNEVTALGIVLDLTQIDEDTYHYRVERLEQGRGHKPRAVDVVSGYIMRQEDNRTTQVAPAVKEVGLWKLVLFYAIFIVLGLAVAVVGSQLTEQFAAGFLRRALAIFLIYGVLFLMLQPQRLVLGSAGDARFNEFIHDVLSGPYADPASLYEQYFPEGRYWEKRRLE